MSNLFVTFMKRLSAALPAWLGHADERPPFMVRYDRVFKDLTAAELSEEPESLDADFGLFDRSERQRHFLNLYSEHGGRQALERYGFLDLLRDKGLDPVFMTDTRELDEHRIKVYDGEISSEHLIIELLVGVRELELPEGTQGHVLLINWLLMQNPRARFSPQRPPLPDQEHPGLGLFLQLGYLLQLVANRLGLDGLMNHPSYFHNAVLYAKFSHFVEPHIEGHFLALQRALSHLTLADATQAITESRVFDDTGQPVVWTPAPQVLPTTPAFRAWFESEDYQRQVTQARDSVLFSIRSPEA